MIVTLETGSREGTIVPGNPPHLLTEQRGHVLEVTLNRPRQRNAITPEMVCLLADAWHQAETDAGIRVVVLTGAGPAFSAGADLKLLIPLVNGDRAAENEWDERVLADPDLAAYAFLRGRSLSKPLIAAVNGPATGGGFELVLATTLRVAAESASFGLSEVRRALIPGGGGVARLWEELPRAQALELLLTGNPVTAHRAAELGLLNRVVPDSELATQAGELSAAIAANGPLAVRHILGIMTRASETGLRHAFALEDDAFAAVTASEDAREGIRAFLEKRTPTYQGR